MLKDVCRVLFGVCFGSWSGECKSEFGDASEKKDLGNERWWASSYRCWEELGNLACWEI
jgi:hypothetical protein